MHRYSSPDWFRDTQERMVACVIGLSVALGACGSDTDPASPPSDQVANDGATNSDGESSDSTPPAASENPDDIAGNPEQNPEPGPAPGAAPANGERLQAESAAFTTVTYDCKLESSTGTVTPVVRTLGFDRATLTFSVNAIPVTVGSFYWSEAQTEWTASATTLEQTAGLAREFFAKLASDNTPTYFRSKETQADYSFEQTECYLGLVVAGPFALDIPESLPAQQVVCRQIETSNLGAGQLNDTGLVNRLYLVREARLLCGIEAQDSRFAWVNVDKIAPRVSTRTLLANGDIKYETSIAGPFQNLNELITDGLGRFKSCSSRTGSRASRFVSTCGDGAEDQTAAGQFIRDR